MTPKTLEEAYQSYLSEVADEVHTGDAIQKAFYMGAIKAIEIVSSHNESLETLGDSCLELTSEIVSWLIPNRGRL